MAIGGTNIPEWAVAILQCPATGRPLHRDGSRLMTSDGVVRASIVDGVVRVAVPGEDPSISFYRAVGGPRFHERSQVGYAMTTLDTSVYHGYLAELRADDPDALVVDVGGGDGRNAMPWLEWGCRRMVVIDPAGAALERLRTRISQRNPEWLDRVLVIEADARRLPVNSRTAARIFAIEALAYLNDDYRTGLQEGARVVADTGRILVADRDYEGALLARLFYVGGVAGLLEQAGSRDVIDGNDEQTTRSRTFTADELRWEVEAVGLRIVRTYGISAMSLILGYLRNSGKLNDEDEARLADVRRLLQTLGREGSMRRSHVIVAERPGP